MDRTHQQVKPSRWAASYLSDVLPHVLDHHFIGSDWLQSEQAPVVDVRLAESDLFLAELDGRESKGLVTRGRNFKQTAEIPRSGPSYLQLIELQQVAVAREGEGKAPLLGPAL